MIVCIDDAPSWGLLVYVRQVTSALSLHGDWFCVLDERRTRLYLAVDGRLAGFHDQNAALLWDAEQGWSAAVASPAGPGLMVISYLGHGVLPAPRVVADWVDRMRREQPTAPARAIGLRGPDRPEDLLCRLAAYTVMDLASTTGIA